MTPLEAAYKHRSTLAQQLPYYAGNYAMGAHSDQMRALDEQIKLLISQQKFNITRDSIWSRRAKPLQVKKGK